MGVWVGGVCVCVCGVCVWCVCVCGVCVCVWCVCVCVVCVCVDINYSNTWFLCHVVTDLCFVYFVKRIFQSITNA